MPDTTFESTLAGQLRDYAEAGVRPIDRFAIAEEAIASGRTMPRWRGGWGLAPTRANRILIPLLVGALLAALAGGAVLVGARLLAPPPLLPTHRAYLNELVSARDLSMPMAHPALVPLLDGRVLVIGDDGDGGSTTSRALVYDPATGVSEPTGPLVSGDLLSPESAVRLKDGKVLVVGEGVAQVFDPSTMGFVAVGPMIVPRSMAAVAALPDGRVLIAGGYPSGQDAATSSAELFDPASMTFSPTGPMSTSRSMPSMAVLPDGRVFVSPGESRTTVETYDPSTGKFSAAGTMTSEDYASGEAIALPDGRVAVLRGRSLSNRGFAEVWDPASLTFSPRRDLPGQVSSSALLDDGRILLVGDRSLGTRTSLYDPTTGMTTSIRSFTRAWWPKATRLVDGRVLIVGGLSDGRIRQEGGGSLAPGVSTVEIFQ